jgi:thioredoxin reductase (NADPH)
VDRTQAFPALTPEQIDRIRPFGKLRQMQPGEILFEPGDVSVPFFVLLSGGMEIVQPSLNGERQIVTHQAGGFTGEMTMISRRGALVRGRVTEPGEFLELSPENLKNLVARDADLSEIFMRAFILRRLLLISYGQGNVVLLGSRHSANTVAASRVSQPQRASPRLHRPGHRRGSAGSAGPVFRNHRGNSRGDLQRGDRAA